MGIHSGTHTHTEKNGKENKRKTFEFCSDRSHKRHIRSGYGVRGKRERIISVPCFPAAPSITLFPSFFSSFVLRIESALIKLVRVRYRLMTAGRMNGRYRQLAQKSIVVIPHPVPPQLPFFFYNSFSNRGLRQRVPSFCRLNPSVVALRFLLLGTRNVSYRR